MLFGLTAACGENTPQTERSAVQQRDSAGVVIIETLGAVATKPIGWTVGDAPDLQLGNVEGKETEQFYRIGGFSGGGITGLADGRIAVVSAGTGELLFFGRDGHFLNRVNIKGNGPGEFRIPYRVPYTAHDSVFIRDSGHRRYTVFSSDGQNHRSFTPGTRVLGTAEGASPAGIVVIAGTDRLPVEGQASKPVSVTWVSLESDRAQLVAQFNVQTYFVPEVGGIPHEFRVPFFTRPSAAVSIDGFFVTGDRPEVLAFDNSGRLTRIFRLTEGARRVTREDVEGAIDSLVARFTTARAEARQAYERMEIPSHWPTFQSVRVDRLGWIWAELYRPPHHLTRPWIVFDSTGVARGSVELPLALEVHDIGADYVLGRWLDDMRVEYVRRYRLDRGR